LNRPVARVCEDGARLRGISLPGIGGTARHFSGEFPIGFPSITARLWTAPVHSTDNPYTVPYEGILTGYG